jgi:hypothetical protein
MAISSARAGIPRPLPCYSSYFSLDRIQSEASEVVGHTESTTSYHAFSRAYRWPARSRKLPGCGLYSCSAASPDIDSELLNYGEHIVTGQARVSLEHFFNAVARTQKLENRLHRDSCSFDDRFAIADFRVDLDAFHDVIIVQPVQGCLEP